MIYNKIQTLEFELSRSCNAYCSVCPRYIEHNGGLYTNPNADLNSHLTPAMVRDIMTGFPLDDVVKIDCIGTVGDPLANKDIVEIVSTIVEHAPYCQLQIHTNGSLRNTKTFEQLAELMPFIKKRVIVFSIDGLIDTNHLYRKKVDFSLKSEKDKFEELKNTFNKIVNLIYFSLVFAICFDWTID